MIKGISSIRERCVLTVGLLLMAGSAIAQDSSSDRNFNCVMEPKSTVELQSSAEGILLELLVKRGERVKKGAVLARLNDDQERLIAERARIRAETDVDERSADTQSEFRRNEVARLIDLRDTNVIPEKEYDLTVDPDEVEALKVGFKECEKYVKRDAIEGLH